MDLLKHARTLYRKRYSYASALSRGDIESLTTSITKLLHTCLMQEGGSTCFEHLPCLHIIKKTIESGRFHGDQAAVAFLTLERYLQMLVAEPWKREFWLLKTYGGFFSSKVKSHLVDSEELLELVGYSKDPSSPYRHCLVLHKAPDIDLLLSVAFDCLVAAMECRYIWVYYNKWRGTGLDLSDAMNVLLSGAPNDPLLTFSAVGPPGKDLFSSNSSLIKAGVDDSQQSSVAAPASSSHTILASGGMGMGVVTGVTPSRGLGVRTAETRPQVSGVSNTLQEKGPTTHPVTEAQSWQRTGRIGSGQQSSSSSVHQVTGVPAMYSFPLDHPAQGDLAHHQYSAIAHPPALTETSDPSVNPPPPSVVSTRAGSRASYASSAYAPSSGYGSGSGSGSVIGGSSSVYTASSGYSSGSPSPCPSQLSGQNDAHLPDKRYTNLTEPVNSRIGQSPTPLPRTQFPYIPEDKATSSCSFPEATHEEHLLESLRNLQGSHGSRVRSKMPAKKLHPQMESELEEVEIEAFDDWQWLRNGMELGDVRHGDGMKRTRSQPLSGPGYQPVQHPANRSRSTASQPATSVTNMLSADTTAASHDLQRQATSARQPRSQDHAYLTAPRSSSETQPVSRHSSEQQRPWKSDTQTLNYKVQDARTVRSGMHPSQPVYYPPKLHSSPHSSTTARRADGSAVMSSQSERMWSGSLNNLDRNNREKVLNTKQEDARRMVLDKVQGDRARGLSSSVMSPAFVGVDTSASVDRMQWECQSCTMWNSNQNTVCMVCGRSRNTPYSPYSSSRENRRPCPDCTFENPLGSSSCQICNSLLT